MLPTLSSLTKSLAFTTLLTACQPTPDSLPYYDTPDFTPVFATDNGIEESVPHTIAAFSFTNQRGQTVTEQTVADKIHVASFMFTTCGVVCPITTDNLQTVSRAFADDTSVVFLSYSVTPWIDTPERLRQYAQLKRIQNPRWHLLTGKKFEIYRLARRSYFAEEDLGFTKDSTEFLHTEHFILVDQGQRIRGVYNGTLSLETKQLIADINRLKEE